MNGKPTWRVARLDDIERRGRDIPVREHLGIHAFGINAFTPSEDGTLVNEHDEAGSGQEELYIVLDGKATFEVDGEAVDAPPGTLVFVGPESRRKATGDGTVLAVGATPGEAYQAIDWGEAWPFHRDSMTAYGEQRYADALESVRGGLAHMPDHAGLNYNYGASRRSRATPATRRSPTSGGRSSCSRGSARTRAETTTSRLYATTRGSNRLFAESPVLDLDQLRPRSAQACADPWVTFANAGPGEWDLAWLHPRRLTGSRGLSSRRR